MSQLWGARTYDGARPRVNTRGLSRLWGDWVKRGGLVGWGDAERGGVLYVRVWIDTGLDDANSVLLSDSLGLSALSAEW